MHVSGHGRINAGAIAVGDQATAVGSTTVNEHRQELQGQLDDLIAQLRARQDELADSEQIVATAQQARDELDKPQPNKFSLLGLLHGIAAGVGSVAGLATSVEAIKLAVTQLL
ncbi:MAG: hypothetical protein ACJ74O_15770 [Frankiaceae bacterium]